MHSRYNCCGVPTAPMNYCNFNSSARTGVLIGIHHLTRDMKLQYDPDLHPV